jgi:hypothetical protein
MRKLRTDENLAILTAIQIRIILPAALGPGVYSAYNRMSTRNINIIMFLGNKVQRLCRADNLTAIRG